MGGFMFDLNELPDEDADPMPQQVPEVLPNSSSPTVSSSEVQLADATPLLPGQHPLSCFRPFVRPILRSASTGEERPPFSKVEANGKDASPAPDVVVPDPVSPSVNAHQADIGSSKQEKVVGETASSGCTQVSEGTSQDMKDLQETAVYDANAMDAVFRQSVQLDGSAKGDAPRGHQGNADGSKGASSFGKRERSGPKDAMLGKKRSRQTMFLDVREAAKQAPPIKTSASKKTLSSQVSFRATKDAPKTPLPHASTETKPKELKLANLSEPRYSSSMQLEGLSSSGTSDVAKQQQAFAKKAESPSDAPTRHIAWKQGQSDDKNKQLQFNSKSLVIHTGAPPSGHSQGKIGSDEKPPSFVRPVTKKNPNNFRKQSASGLTYNAQDSSIERLHREATFEKLWRSPGEAELQCVPGSFESVQDYVNVFEPLLFEECRAQLHSTWEELSDGVSKDPHIQVSVKTIEKRERGWFEAVLLPIESYARLGFKEGDVAVLSTPKPGSAGRMKRSNGSGFGDLTSEFSSRTAGIIRRYIPVDVRDPHGAVLRLYVGESAGLSNEEQLRKKFQSKGVTWYLTILGSLATTQREYVALHAFQHLHSQMIKAILHPNPELFPCYGEDPPAMPECFTQSFTQHLHRNFNDPQLAAIKWAAMHTAAGSLSNSNGKRSDLWPFTLVQGPPGTGKTHTVWGMLNVIHLVQYQRYYAALLKKLAPDSLKANDVHTSNEGSSGLSEGSGSIDDVLQKMDQNLARILPKLCPKPRMLVCAPSNAATDELLSRVLEKGFIDGEMKVYRPDIARVGVDTQSRASQAVSVERRSDQLLGMSRDDVVGWLQQLRSRENFLSQQIASLQKELSMTAAAARSQGSVGVDPEVLVARDQTRDAKLKHLAAVVEERDKVLVEMSRLFIVEGRSRIGYSLEDARAKLEASFANEAEIVFTTVSSSGRRLFNNLTHGFDMVVIDEAAQASEVAVLPPLSLGAARCVLIGDPQQLPATVISRAAHTLQYSRSLFERLQQAGCPAMLLSVQYRMHPQIRDFPSRYFYQGRLVDSDSVSSLPDEAYHGDQLLRPYIFYDISRGRESHKGGSVSYQNVTEAQFAAQLYDYLLNFSKSAGLSKVSVGVITPYKLQLKCLQQEFGSLLGPDIDSKAVYINTVDAFQGQERDVIIMSCVRASSHGVGFVADIRRMNVALTRARRCLWVVGNAAALVQSEDWAALIADAKERGCFVSMDTPAVENLLALSRTSSHCSSGRAMGHLRAPHKPSGMTKGGPPNGEPKTEHVFENKQVSVGSVKSVPEIFAVQSIKAAKDSTVKAQESMRDSRRPEFTTGSNKAPLPLYPARADRTVKQNRAS